MTDDQLLRYSRHVLLEDIGIEGQERLLKAKVLVIGAGGLGCVCGLFLGSAGVGEITIADHDVVDSTNLQRQIAHRLDRIGMNKAQSLAKSISQINPDVVVRSIERKVGSADLLELVQAADLVLDCSDNFETRHAVNRVCVDLKKPLVSGAAIRMDGQVAVFDPQNNSSPCYACIFPKSASIEEAQCATMGVFAPLVGVIGSMQAMMALNMLIQTDRRRTAPMLGRLLMLDGRRLEWTDLKISRDPNCSVCANS